MGYLGSVSLFLWLILAYFRRAWERGQGGPLNMRGWLRKAQERGPFSVVISVDVGGFEGVIALRVMIFRPK